MCAYSFQWLHKVKKKQQNPLYITSSSVLNSRRTRFFLKISSGKLRHETTVWDIVVRCVHAFKRWKYFMNIGICCCCCRCLSIRFWQKRRVVVCIMESNGASLSELTCRQPVVQCVSMWTFANSESTRQSLKHKIEQKKRNMIFDFAKSETQCVYQTSLMRNKK